MLKMQREPDAADAAAVRFSCERRWQQCQDRLDRTTQARCRYCKGDHVTRFKAGESGRARAGANGATGGRGVTTGRPATTSHTKEADAGTSANGRNCGCYAQNACE